MRKISIPAGVVVIAALLSCAPAWAQSPPMWAPASTAVLKGRYLIDRDSTRILTIRRLDSTLDAYIIAGDQWQAVGFLDGTSYWGVFRYPATALPPDLAGARGIHRGTLRSDGALVIHGEFDGGRAKPFDTVWSPERTPPVPPAQFQDPPPSDGLPQLTDYVYVEELPEALTKVPPVYPPGASGVEGTVLVQALVGQDGTVKDAKIVKSIPDLDDAAVACVRQWIFKPAQSKGKPVAVWVAVPVKFSAK